MNRYIKPRIKIIISEYDKLEVEVNDFIESDECKRLMYVKVTPISTDDKTAMAMITYLDSTPLSKNFDPRTNGNNFVFRKT